MQALKLQIQAKAGPCSTAAEARGEPILPFNPLIHLQPTSADFISI